MQKPKLMISSCILGNNVRFDGSNKLDQWITNRLGAFFDIVAVCPEVAMGMGVPRESVNLRLSKDGHLSMIGNKSNNDYTNLARETSQSILDHSANELCGAILQKKSPSCGVERVKLYNEKNDEIYTIKNSEANRGIFASMLIKQKPMLPVIDSGRFYDEAERENFLRRVVCYSRFFSLDGSIRSLQDFHARYKFVIMEHSQEKMRQLGNLAANRENKQKEEVYKEYAQLLFEALLKIPSKKSRTNVFYHLIGFFKNQLQDDEKKIVHQMIADYHSNILPYQVPLKMIEYLITKHEQYYLKGHYLFNQFPKELYNK